MIHDARPLAIPTTDRLSGDGADSHLLDFNAGVSVRQVKALQAELAEAKAEAQRLADRNRDLIRQNSELRKAGNVLSKESFDECADDAAVVVDIYELSKLVQAAVKDERHRLRDGECIYVAIDLPRTFKSTGDAEFPDLTAMRCDSPDRTAVAYEIHVG